VFKKLFAAMGVGSAEVDTRLHSNIVVPGGHVSGEVVIKGGQVNQEIEQLTIFLMTEAEVEHGDSEHRQAYAISRWQVARGFKVYANEQTSIPFELPVHLETPITDLSRPAPSYTNGGAQGKGLFESYGKSAPQPAYQPAPLPQTSSASLAMRGTRVWIHTGLEIEDGVDASDRDMLVVRPTEPMSRFLAAVESLGFTLKAADVERGSLRGQGFQSTLGCYQELEYGPGYGHNFGIKQLEISFVTRPHDTGVLLEVDRRFGYGDSYRSLMINHSSYQQVNWEGEISRVLGLR
jgi:sporulation-control protein